jgi:glycerophosphoryl diester phosphodiesterase
MNQKFIGHRGLAAIAPENTLAAFRMAIAQEFYGIEFDVQLSLDHLPMIIHDPTLERTTNGVGFVKDQTVTQLKKLDAASWFSDQFQGEKIPTFAEIFALLANTNLQIYPEIKATENWTNSDIQNFLETIVTNNYLEKCTIISFDQLFLTKVQEINQDVKIGYNSANLNDYQSSFKLALKTNEPLLIIQYRLLLENPQIIQECHDHNIKIIAWTVDDPESQQKLINLGVTKIITNGLIA